MRFHLDVHINLTATGGISQADTSDAIIRELHDLEHFDGRRECSVRVSDRKPSHSVVEVDLYVEVENFEAAFTTGMVWLRSGFENASVPASRWQRSSVLVEVEEDTDLPGLRVIRPASEPDPPEE